MSRQLTALALLLSGCAKEAEEPVVEAAAAGTLTITAPAAGDWLPTGTTTVTGRADGVTSVSIDGVDVDLVDGVFTGEAALARGINLIEVVAVEGDGDTLFQRHGVIAGDFAAPDDAVPSAAVARLNKSGLDDLAEFGVTFVDDETIAAALAEADPVFSEELISGTWAEAVLSGISFGTPALTLTPTPGALEIEVVLPDLDADTSIYGEIVWIDFDQELEITADAATIRAELVLGAEDGQITVDLLDPEVTLDGFAYDLSLLPSFVEDYVFTSSVQSALEEQLVAQLGETVPEVIDETLSTLDFSFETEVMETTLGVSAAFSRADVDGDGIEIAVDMDVSVPMAGTQAYNGYLSTGTTLGSPDASEEVAMLLSDDLLNRIAFEVWRGGLMEMTLSTEDGSLDPSMVEMLKAPAADVAISAALPPVITQSEAGVLQLQIAELRVVLQTPGGELGEEMVLDVAAFAELLPVLEGGALSMSLGELEVTIATRSSDWGASTEATTRLVEEMLPLELIPAMLSEISFPIPELGGLTISEAVVSRPTATATAITLDVAAVQ